jgi:creatinine amidohydrolase
MAWSVWSFLNGHSGNAPLIDQAVRKVRQETQIVVPSINVWRLHTPQVWNEAYGVPAGKGFGHGAEPIGSVYAYLFPGLLRPDLLERPQNGKRFLGFEAAGFGGVKFRGIDIAMPLDVTDLTDNGIINGDPAVASAEAGQRLAYHIVETTVAFIAEFRDAPQPQAQQT